MTPVLYQDPGPSQIDVLLIEDDPVDEAAMLRTVAQQGLPYRMHVARSVAQARAVLAGRSFDVILADHQLPDGSSSDLMDAFGEQLVIFVTGAWDAAAAANALRIGVHDYLIKDSEGTYLKLLHYRVETALRQRRLARQLRDSEALLQAILDHAPAAISAHDLAGRLILSNRQHARLVATAIQPAEPALLPAGPVEDEETLHHADGSAHTYLTVRFPMADAQGRPLAVGRIAVDISARKAAEEQIRNLAFYDPLTGLPNRRMLFDRLHQATATSARHGHHGAVFFIDLDHFKVLNDTLGHDHGDLLLQEVARRLLACVRGEDTVARFGGDEFVVMSVGLAADARSAATQAAVVAEKILLAVSQPAQLGLHSHTLTPSIGVGLFRGRELASEDILKRADLAMYQAKAAGRGTVRFFDPVMQAGQAARAAMEHDLRRALGAGQMCLHFQGVVDETQGTVGAEALLRWQHPQHGLLRPEQFLPLAEQNGLIVPIGMWVVETACEQLGRWAAMGAPGQLHLAVNISARQFREEGFVEGVAQALRRHGADPRRLRLELRESLLQDNPARTLARMAALKALGVGFVLDDFGISYSSLSVLKRLPLDQIKISQSLMHTLVTDPHDAAIVRTIVGIAQGLGVGASAVGVETLQQRNLLRELGCLQWQGDYFGAPAPLGQFERLLQAPPAHAA
ncbi:MAG: EAL domain-containing protein [Rubrivivax sp.]|nr:EAL domain-containing protein [Rubrivivax sp.]